MRQRRFDGTGFEPKKLLENAQTPTTIAPALFAGGRVHAVLGCFIIYKAHFIETKYIANPANTRTVNARKETPFQTAFLPLTGEDSNVRKIEM